MAASDGSHFSFPLNAMPLLCTLLKQTNIILNTVQSKPTIKNQIVFPFHLPDFIYTKAMENMLIQ
jgi:hypothetical protein